MADQTKRGKTKNYGIFRFSLLFLYGSLNRTKEFLNLTIWQRIIILSHNFRWFSKENCERKITLENLYRIGQIQFFQTFRQNMKVNWFLKKWRRGAKKIDCPLFKNLLKFNVHTSIDHWRQLYSWKFRNHRSFFGILVAEKCSFSTFKTLY